MMINYGLNKVRFPAPLPVGARVRMRLRLTAVDDVEGGDRAAHLRADLRARRRREARVCGGVALARLYGLDVAALARKWLIGRSPEQTEGRLSFFNDIRGELRCFAAADVLHRVDRSVWDEQHIAGLGNRPRRPTLKRISSTPSTT